MMMIVIGIVSFKFMLYLIVFLYCIKRERWIVEIYLGESTLNSFLKILNVIFYGNVGLCSSLIMFSNLGLL